MPLDLEGMDLWDGVEASLRAKLKPKNEKVWQELWSEIVASGYLDGLEKSGIEIALPTLEAIQSLKYSPAVEFFVKRGMEFVDGMTDTDVSQIKTSLEQHWGDPDGFVQDLEPLYSENRLLTIYRSEIHISQNNAALETAKRVGVQTKTRRATGDERMCPICESMDGETVDVDDLFEDGTADACTHPGCRCTLMWDYVEKSGTSEGVERSWLVRDHGLGGKYIPHPRTPVEEGNGYLSINTSMATLPMDQQIAINTHLEKCGIKKEDLVSSAVNVLRNANKYQWRHKDVTKMGIDWYRRFGQAIHEISKEYDLTTPQFAGVVASTSSNNPWEAATMATETEPSRNVLINLVVAMALADIHQKNPVVEIAKEDVNKLLVSEKNRVVMEKALSPDGLKIEDFIGYKGPLNDLHPAVAGMEICNIIRYHRPPDMPKDERQFLDDATWGLKNWFNAYEATRIMRGEDPNLVLTGDKRKSYNNNFLGSENDVTVDRWMKRFFVNRYIQNRDTLTQVQLDNALNRITENPKQGVKRTGWVIGNKSLGGVGIYPVLADTVRDATKIVNSEKNIYENPLTYADSQAILWYVEKGRSEDADALSVAATAANKKTKVSKSLIDEWTFDGATQKLRDIIGKVWDIEGFVPEDVIRKWNDCHDELGRFCEGGGIAADAGGSYNPIPYMANTKDEADRITGKLIGGGVAYGLHAGEMHTGNLAVSGQNILNKKLTEFKSECQRLDIPMIGAIIADDVLTYDEVGYSSAAGTGDGRLYIHSSLFKFEKPDAEKLKKKFESDIKDNEDQIANMSKLIGVYDNEPANSHIDKNYAKEVVEHRTASLKAVKRDLLQLENCIKSDGLLATNVWDKESSTANERPMVAAALLPYNKAPEALLDHEFGHHIMQSFDRDDPKRAYSNAVSHLFDMSDSLYHYDITFEQRQPFRDQNFGRDQTVNVASKYGDTNYREWHSESYCLAKNGREDLVYPPLLKLMKEYKICQ